MLLGKRVITPDKEQGFISCVYEDGNVDVDILEDDVETAEHTTTIDYKLDAISTCVDQTPQLCDITPFGQVTMLGMLTDGIIEVVLDTGNDRKNTLWIAEQRYDKLPQDRRPTWGHWTDPANFTEWVNYYDLYLNDDGCIDPKRIFHEQIPYEAFLRVERCDGETEFWNAAVDENGLVDYVKTDDGMKITTLEQLRTIGINTAELQCSYAIEDFDRDLP